MLFYNTLLDAMIRAVTMERVDNQERVDMKLKLFEVAAYKKDEAILMLICACNHDGIMNLIIDKFKGFKFITQPCGESESLDKEIIIYTEKVDPNQAITSRESILWYVQKAQQNWR